MSLSLNLTRRCLCLSLRPRVSDLTKITPYVVFSDQTRNYASTTRASVQFVRSMGSPFAPTLASWAFPAAAQPFSTTTRSLKQEKDEEHHILTDYHPRPPLPVFQNAVEPLNTQALEDIDVGIGKHRETEGVSDAIAYGTVKFLRIFADGFFRKRYIHRAIVLETVAGVPGMVAAMTRHLTSLRRMRHDGGWINQLLLEAENERMHLMTWMKMTSPTPFERFLVLSVQALFSAFYTVVYVLFPKTAHRLVGYLEEEAVISYTQFLAEIDAGRIENVAAPDLAIQYWHLSADARLRDVVLAVRADEAGHRDANHAFADKLVAKQEDLRKSKAAQVDKTEK